MANFEGSRRQRLEWIEARVALWQLNAPLIGIAPAQITAIKAQVLANRTDFGAAEAARNAAKAATLVFYTSGNTMAGTTRDLIAVIKGYAESTNNPNVYALANIEPPAGRTVLPAPDMPSDFTGSVTPNGDVMLAWKATPSGRSSGVFFLVERKRGSGEWVPMGGTAEKAFVDPDPQLVTGIVQYQVKAVRGELESEWTTPISFNLAGGAGDGSSVVGVVGGAGGVGAQAA